MVKIAPSILSADFANLERDIQRISTADYVHVDVMDGMFVPNITIGADLVTAHVESDTEENIHAALDKIHAKGKRAGIVLKPKTPAEAALPFLEKVDLILVMTVEPGFGGQKFMSDMMPKVKALRQMLDEVNPGCVIEVDGGVDVQTCALCKENGAEVLVAGSAYFKAPDRAAFVKTVQESLGSSL